MSLPRRPIYQALHQPNLIGGAERGPALTLTFACVGLAMNGATLVAVIIAAGLWFVGFPLLRRAAKADSKMAEIYRRFTRYQGYYAPRSSPWCAR